MALTDAQKAYMRGYNAGRRNAWPAHMPPAPPEPVVARLLKALESLAGEYGYICATFEEDDPLVVKLGPLVDEANETIAGVTEWLKSQ
jgi:hypothetical protein